MYMFEYFAQTNPNPTKKIKERGGQTKEQKLNYNFNNTNILFRF